MSYYQDPNAALKYMDFLNSKNGEIQKHALYRAIYSRLGQKSDVDILDAGCGPGWLSEMLKKDFTKIQGCDASEFFIQFAKATYPGINFKTAVLAKPLPYPQHFFDVVILNMAGPDIADLKSAFRNLAEILKGDGKIMLTIPNPPYTYPAAEWKRGVLDIIFFRKPKLKLKIPPQAGAKTYREFGKGSKIASFYYTLDSFTDAAQAAGMKLSHREEIKSLDDSPDFDLIYQLHRYPLFLLLELTKV